MAYENEVGSIVVNILQTMLGWDASVLEEKNLECSGEQESLCGNISIMGDWQGSFLLCLPLSLARKVAETMFGMNEGEAGDSEISDAIGELANMTGGNFKSTLEGACQLSLPSVIRGQKFMVQSPGTELVCQLVFETQGEKFELSMMQGG